MLSILNKFSALSSKSELFPVNKASIQRSWAFFQFRVVNDQFTYLGITRNYSTLFQKNIDNLMQNFPHPVEIPTLIANWLELM